MLLRLLLHWNRGNFERSPSTDGRSEYPTITTASTAMRTRTALELVFVTESFIPLLYRVGRYLFTRSATRSMRIPRWLVMSLIGVSVVAPVAFLAWLWIDMPRRTAVAFAEATNNRNAVRTNQLLVNARCELPSKSESTILRFRIRTGGTWIFSDVQMRLAKRELWDVLRGNHPIAIDSWGGESDLRFFASWNAVTAQPPDGFLSWALRHSHTIQSRH
jgi:hypothetical protein